MPDFLKDNLNELRPLIMKAFQDNAAQFAGYTVHKKAEPQPVLDVIWTDKDCSDFGRRTLADGSEQDTSRNAHKSGPGLQLVTPNTFLACIYYPAQDYKDMQSLYKGIDTDFMALYVNQRYGKYLQIENHEVMHDKFDLVIKNGEGSVVTTLKNMKLNDYWNPETSTFSMDKLAAFRDSKLKEITDKEQQEIAAARAKGVVYRYTPPKAPEFIPPTQSQPLTIKGLKTAIDQNEKPSRPKP